MEEPSDRGVREDGPVLAGVAFFPTEDSIRPDRLGPALEARGFESVWVAEHSHIPVSRKSAWPGGDELPRHYYETYDPFVWLSAAAAATTTLRVATGICLVAQRDPIHTAKEVASLDSLSGGRFDFGVGAGWNEDEMNNHGTALSGRFGLLRERIEAMKAIWTADRAEYHGDRVDFDPIMMWPKPTQKPHPPIHVGGMFPGAARRALRWGDGWFPIPGRGESDYGELRGKIAELAGAEGRDPAEIEITVFGAGADEAAIEQFRKDGVDRVTLFVPPVDRDASLAALDEQRALADRVG